MAGSHVTRKKAESSKNIFFLEIGCKKHACKERVEKKGSKRFAVKSARANLCKWHVMDFCRQHLHSQGVVEALR